MAPSLPLDVLITIIDLHKEDDAALKAWTLVSRHSLNFARSHLFRTIDMRKYHGIAGERLFIRLYQFLSTNPHIGLFVRNLHFFEVDALHPYMTLSCEHRDFPRLLKLLPELQCFGLYFSEITSWQDRSRGFVKAMEELGRRPTFKELRLSGVIRVPAFILNHCTSLKRLCLEDVTFIHPLNSIRFDLKPRKNQKLAPSPDVKVPDSINLEDASFTGADMQIFQWSSRLSLINFSKLRSLAIDFDIKDFDQVWEAIHSVQKSLSVLKLGQTKRGLGHSIYRSEGSFLASDFTLQSSPIDAEIRPDFATLSPLTNLMNLSIVISFPGTKRHIICERIISEWCALLQTAHNGLQSISITLDFTFFGKSELKTILASRIDCFGSELKGKSNPNILACLDEKLASPILFPVLSSVEIAVESPNTDVGPFTSSWRDSESSLDSENEYPSRRIRRPIKPEILKISIIRMMKLTRKRFEATMVEANTCHFVVSVN